MGSLYIVTSENAAGKTTICAGLAINLINSGKKVGYLNLKSAGKNDDTSLMKQIPRLEIITGKTDVLKDRDVVLVEADLTDQISGTAKEMKAKVIVVEAYTGEALKKASLYKGIGDSLMGVIINKVPQILLKSVKGLLDAKSGEAGIKVLGVIPENSVLLAITVGELAECISGKILNNAEKSQELVENFMLGALIVDSGLDYFSRKKDKAVIIREERPDMQLAALETATKCLVLSGGNKQPTYGVLYKAETKGIPIITTATSVNDIITNVENKLMKTMLNHEKKLAKLSETVKDNLDMKVFG